MEKLSGGRLKVPEGMQLGPVTDANLSRPGVRKQEDGGFGKKKNKNKKRKRINN